MPVAAPASSESVPFVEAVIRYTDPASAGAKLKPRDHASSSFALLEHRLPIRNARLHEREISLERNGFTRVRHATNVDLLDKAAVEKTYYREAEDIVKALTGASASRSPFATPAA